MTRAIWNTLRGQKCRARRRQVQSTFRAWRAEQQGRGAITERMQRSDGFCGARQQHTQRVRTPQRIPKRWRSGHGSRLAAQKAQQ